MKTGYTVGNVYNLVVEIKPHFVVAGRNVQLSVSYID